MKIKIDPKKLNEFISFFDGFAEEFSIENVKKMKEMSLEEVEEKRKKLENLKEKIWKWKKTL